MQTSPSESPAQANLRGEELTFRSFVELQAANLGKHEPIRRMVSALQLVVAFARRFDLALVSALTALLYVIRYLNFTFPTLPWFGWSDQGEYASVAKDLAAFKIGYSVHPLGYPLLGAFCARFLPGHPFFLPDLCCAVGIALFFYASARQVVTRLEALALVIAGIVVQSYFWVWTLIVPWNVIPVAFVAVLCVYLTVFIKPTVVKMQICGAAIAAAFLCRPWDAFFLCIMYAGGLYTLATWRERFRASAVLIGGIVLAALLIVADYMIVFGKPFNPYMQGLANQGISFVHYPFRLYQIFLDANVIGNSFPSTVLDKMPWLVLIIPGAWLLIRRYGVRAVAWIAAVLSMTAFYLSMNGMIPSAFWDYHGYRYLCCWIPYTVLLAYLSITRAWSVLGWKAVCSGFGIVFLVLAVVGWRPVVMEQWPTSSGFTNEVLSFKKEMVDKTLLVSVQFSKPTTVDGLRLRFERGLMVPMESALSLRGSAKTDGRPLTVWKEFVIHQEKDGTLTIFFVNSPASQDPVSTIDLRFEGIDNDSLTNVRAVRAEFHLFGYLTRTYDRLAQGITEAEVNAYIVPTPWDLTGSAAGIPDGQIDFAVDCHLPAKVRHRLADMEIILRSGNAAGKWATHSRGMNWDKLVFMPGYVENNLRHHPPITNLADIVQHTGKFTILFKLPEPDRGLPLTLVGLDREGNEIFEKEMAGVQ